MKPTVAIAGATGFIGRWFIEHYSHKYRIIALSRREMDSSLRESVEWRKVDMYSVSSTIKALEGADYALYLVHSMQPSARLNQGSFDDTDLLLADNFARAAETRSSAVVGTAAGGTTRSRTCCCRNRTTRWYSAIICAPPSPCSHMVSRVR